VTATREPLTGSTEETTARSEVAQAPCGPGGERYDPVTGAVTPAARGHELGAQAKPYQVRQVLELLERYGLELKEHE